jgi:hypothetical protein
MKTEYRVVPQEGVTIGGTWVLVTVLETLAGTADWFAGTKDALALAGLIDQAGDPTDRAVPFPASLDRSAPPEEPPWVPPVPGVAVTTPMGEETFVPYATGWEVSGPVQARDLQVIGSVNGLRAVVAQFRDGAWHHARLVTPDRDTEGAAW